MEKTLNVLLANVFELYFKAHGMHWNIEGKDFPILHKFFGDIYEEVYASIDGLAEEIRSAGVYVNYGCEITFQNTTLPTMQLTGDVPAEMLKSLLLSNDIVLESYRKTFVEASDEGFKDFLAGGIDAHTKIKWKLTSTLKGYQ